MSYIECDEIYIETPIQLTLSGSILKHGISRIYEFTIKMSEYSDNTIFTDLKYSISENLKICNKIDVINIKTETHNYKITPSENIVGESYFTVLDPDEYYELMNGFGNIEMIPCNIPYEINTDEIKENYTHIESYLLEFEYINSDIYLIGYHDGSCPLDLIIEKDEV